VIALGMATRPEPASATSCHPPSTRIQLLGVTEDGAPGTVANYAGQVLLFGREWGVLEINAQPQSSNTAVWVEKYRVATPSSP
jgi:hypothetical protein